MLEESTLPIDKVRLLASARSAGKTLKFKDQDITIEETTETAFEGVDIALFQQVAHHLPSMHLMQLKLER